MKLICGASSEDVVAIRSLALAYSLVGVDAIDCAAEAAVVAAVRDGVAAAARVAARIDPGRAFRPPWIMARGEGGGGRCERGKGGE